MAKKKQSPFEMAFTDARSRGEENFNFNNKEYTTKQKDETDTKWRSHLRSRKLRKLMDKNKSYPV